MFVQRYTDTGSFARDVRDVLLTDEAQNNLMLSFLGNKTDEVKNWLMAAVRDSRGRVVLTAACTPPYNIVLYETGNRPSGPAVGLLADHIKKTGFDLPGVLSEESLARRFAEVWTGSGWHMHMNLRLMQLKTVEGVKKAAGFIRPVRAEDLCFAPYWYRAFSEECRVKVFGISELAEDIRRQIGGDSYYIWEDRQPVSQAALGHVTPNGAVVNAVYTPPYYRGRGYATSCVAALSQMLLDRGYKFCALFADAANPVSCAIYRKIGFRDICSFAEIKFD